MAGFGNYGKNGDKKSAAQPALAVPPFDEFLFERM
jgi:hypothetical protein